MAVIYMPKRQDAWAQMLPQILGQMVQTKFEHNLAMEQNEATLKFKEVEMKAKEASDIRKAAIGKEHAFEIAQRELDLAKQEQPVPIEGKTRAWIPGEGWKYLDEPEPQVADVGGIKRQLVKGKDGQVYYREIPLEGGGRQQKRKNLMFMPTKGGSIVGIDTYTGERVMTGLETYEGKETILGLTMNAMKGDKAAKAVLDRIMEDKAKQAGMNAKAQVKAKLSVVPIKELATAIIEGREIIANVKNTFGLAVQESVRAEVLKMDPEYNFNQPAVRYDALKSSMRQQQKVRCAMGSFVTNLNTQVERVKTFMQDTINRVGARAVDLPYRELVTRFKGSGHERVLESYMIEISNEIAKLSTGSSASIRELSTDAQERWARIHDPNLSFGELVKILEETRRMADYRLSATDDEIEQTMQMLQNVRQGRSSVLKGKPAGTIGKYKIRSVR